MSNTNPRAASSAVRVFARAGYQRVMVLGGPALAEPLRQAGLEVVPPAREARGGGGARADAVLAGWFPEFTMPALEAACHAIWEGAELYSCSQTPFFAVAGGRALGTSRAISAMIRSLTGCGLRVVGKPSLEALRSAADRLGVPAAHLAVVGDDPQLEVPMAHRGRSLAIAVGTGLGGSASYDGLPVSRRPHLQVRGVDELLEILTAKSELEGAVPPLPRAKRPPAPPGLRSEERATREGGAKKGGLEASGKAERAGKQSEREAKG